MYVVQVVEEELEGKEDEVCDQMAEVEEVVTRKHGKGNPEISLNAITRTQSPVTMRILGNISEQRVVILVD